jgi:hypothetical protein
MDITTVMAYRVLGSTPDVTSCDLCGRSDLKGTIILQPLDAEGNAEPCDPVHFGSDCGARAAGWTQREIKRLARTADDERRAAEAAARETEREAEFARWTAFVAQAAGITPNYRGHIGEPVCGFDLGAAIAKLGGYGAARSMYKARDNGGMR